MRLAKNRIEEEPLGIDSNGSPGYCGSVTIKLNDGFLSKDN